MRNLLIAGVAVLGLVGTAYAGEGNGEPFPGPSAEVTTNVTTGNIVHRDADPYQYRMIGTPTAVSQTMVTHHDADPYQLRMAGQVINTGSDVQGPQTGTATASTTRGLTTPTNTHG